jgi:hypothetical protein
MNKLFENGQGLGLVHGTGTSTLSLPLGMLLFYLSVSNNYIGGLLNYRIQSFFKNNYWAKHIIGFMILLLTITYTSGIDDFWKMIGTTMLMYMWFILLNKMPPPWTFGILILLFVLFIINNYKSKLNMQDHSDQIKKINRWTGILFSIALFGTLIGSGFNLAHEMKKNKDDFSLIHFLFGSHNHHGRHLVFPDGQPPSPKHNKWWTWENTLKRRG